MCERVSKLASLASPMRLLANAQQCHFYLPAVAGRKAGGAPSHGPRYLPRKSQNWNCAPMGYEVMIMQPAVLETCNLPETPPKEAPSVWASYVRKPKLRSRPDSYWSQDLS